MTGLQRTIHVGLKHKFIASAGKRRVDIEVLGYPARHHGQTNVVLDLSLIHERHGTCNDNTQANRTPYQNT